MTYPILALVALALVCGAGIAGYIYRGRYPIVLRHVAHTDELTQVGLYRKELARARRRRIVFTLTACVSVVMAALLTALPITQDRYSAQRASRDIMLCLDASGSMLPLDRDLVNQLDTLVEQFHGERVGLMLWNSATMTVFPLTDDYALVHKNLLTLADLLTSVHAEGTQVYGSPDLGEYLRATTPSTAAGGSLIGDGLASCSLAFPHNNRDERGRAIVFVTDNQLDGTPIYTLEQALTVADDHNIDVYSIFDRMETTQPEADHAGNELRTLTTKHGGYFFNVHEGAHATDVLNRIDQMATHHVDTATPPTPRDHTAPYATALVICVIVAFTVGVKR